MSDIKDILKGSFARLGVAKQMQAINITQAAEKQLGLIVGEDAFEVISFKDGVLKVYVESSSVANTLNLAWPKIKKNLQNEGFEIQRVIFTPRSNPRPQ